MAEPLSLYLHIPFCTAKCGYCDFNSYAGQEHLVPSYTATLVHEAQLWHSATAGRQVKTVFFGGGTPSLLPLDDFGTLMDGMREAFDIVPDAELVMVIQTNVVADFRLAERLLEQIASRLLLGEELPSVPDRAETAPSNLDRLPGVKHLTIRGQDECHVVTQLGQFGGQGAAHIAKPAGSGKW